jgi:hypothetical protein
MVYRCLVLAAILTVLAACKPSGNGAPGEPSPAPTATLEPLPTGTPLEGFFDGNLNGFTFGPDVNAPDMRALSSKCTGSNGRRGNPADLSGAPIDFELSYLPPTARPGSTIVMLCEDEVVSVQKDYVLDGGSLQVTRNTGPPFVASSSGDSLLAADIAGRPAVINDRAPPPKAIYLRDDKGLWKIVGRLSIEELHRVAAGIQTK